MNESAVQRDLLQTVNEHTKSPRILILQIIAGFRKISIIPRNPQNYTMHADLFKKIIEKSIENNSKIY